MSAYLVLLLIIVSAVPTAYLRMRSNGDEVWLAHLIALKLLSRVRTDDERRFGIAPCSVSHPCCCSRAFADVGISKTASLARVAISSAATPRICLFGGIDRSLCRCRSVASNPAWLKVAIVPITVGSIMLANYRTSILAMLPLLIYFLLYASAASSDPACGRWSWPFSGLGWCSQAPRRWRRWTALANSERSLAENSRSFSGQTNHCG